MRRQHGGQFGVELFSLGSDNLGHRRLQSLVYLLEGKVLGVLFSQQGAAPQPGQRNNLDIPAGRRDTVNPGAVGDIDVFHRQGIENFGGGGFADSVGQVVVAD
ncbi:hypothetical protein ES703_107078 [subsurface metagenome]